MSASTSESPEHLHLKRLALIWAHAHGYSIAAAEVSVPSLRFRLDAAAYRLGKESVVHFDPAKQKRRRMSIPALGITAIFECKVSRPDYLRDAHSIADTVQRLKEIVRAKERYEEVLKIHYPSIRNGDSLFPEYETLNFERPGYEAYQNVLDEMRLLSSRLHAKTKFNKLSKWHAANLHYIVAEPGLIEMYELPAGWGLLVRCGDALTLTVRPVFHDIESSQRLLLLHRIAIVATRAVHAVHQIDAKINRPPAAAISSSPQAPCTDT